MCSILDVNLVLQFFFKCGILPAFASPLISEERLVVGVSGMYDLILNSFDFYTKPLKAGAPGAFDFKRNRASTTNHDTSSSGKNIGGHFLDEHLTD